MLHSWFHRTLRWSAAALFVGLVGCREAPVSASDAAVSEAAPQAAPAAEGPGGLAALNGFVENRGQWDDEVRFFARRHGVAVTVTADALVFRPVGSTAEPLVLRFPEAAETRRVEGVGELETRHSFFRGGRSASGAAGYQRVVVHDLRRGVNLVLRSNGDAFEYDIELAPGAALAEVELTVEGAERIELRDAETLALHTADGEVLQSIKASWQGEGRAPVRCAFRVLAQEGPRPRFGFVAPGWDDSLALVVDPDLVYGTYVGGPAQELLSDMEVGPDGSAYLYAETWGLSPTTPGSFQESYGGITDAWIGKLSPDGSTLEWSTFLGGALNEDLDELELDSDGSVVVTGISQSADFPTTPGSYQPDKAGSDTHDIFVTRITPDGQSLAWSTYIGGAGNQSARALALYPNGDVLLGGVSYDADFPVTPGAYDEVWAVGKHLIFRLSASGDELIFSTYYFAALEALAVHEDWIYVAGVGTEPSPTTPGVLKQDFVSGDPYDSYVAKLGPNVSHVEWGTFLGGEGADVIDGFSVDAAGAIYVYGDTQSLDFPVTPGVFQVAHPDPGADAGYVSKLLPNGTGLAWSTFLSNPCCSGGSSIFDFGLDSAGNVHVAGGSSGPGWPTTPDAVQVNFVGPFTDATYAKVDALGETLLYATFLGSPTGFDGKTRVGLSSSGSVVIGFKTWGDGMLTTPGAYQPSWAGNDDLAAFGIDLGLLPWRTLGGGLSGASETPNLAGVGVLSPKSTTNLVARGAAPSAPGWLVAGFSEWNLPLLGGTLVPSPDVYAPIAVDAEGALDVSFPWPSVPAGTELFAQAWFFDTGAPFWWSATNALQMTAQ